MKILLLGLFLAASCGHHARHGSHEHHHKQHHGDANKHMLQTDHAELIKRFDDPARDEWQKPQRVLELMGPLTNKKIIDIGAGSGYFTKYFLKAKANVVAADVDGKFLLHLKEIFPAKKYPNITFSSIAYDNPKMDPAGFDFAFTSNTYHHIENRIEYLKKVKAGLKIGGKFVVVDFRPNPKAGKVVGPPLKMRVPATTVISEMLAAGFDHLSIIENELDHQYVIIGQRTF